MNREELKRKYPYTYLHKREVQKNADSSYKGRKRQKKQKEIAAARETAVANEHAARLQVEAMLSQERTVASQGFLQYNQQSNLQYLQLDGLHSAERTRVQQLMGPLWAQQPHFMGPGANHQQLVNPFTPTRPYHPVAHTEGGPRRSNVRPPPAAGPSIPGQPQRAPSEGVRGAALTGPRPFIISAPGRPVPMPPRNLSAALAGEEPEAAALQDEEPGAKLEEEPPDAPEEDTVEPDDPPEVVEGQPSYEELVQKARAAFLELQNHPLHQPAAFQVAALGEELPAAAQEVAPPAFGEQPLEEEEGAAVQEVAPAEPLEVDTAAVQVAPNEQPLGEIPSLVDEEVDDNKDDPLAMVPLHQPGQMVPAFHGSPRVVGPMDESVANVRQVAAALPGASVDAYLQFVQGQQDLLQRGAIAAVEIQQRQNQQNQDAVVAGAQLRQQADIAAAQRVRQQADIAAAQREQDAVIATKKSQLEEKKLDLEAAKLDNSQKVTEREMSWESTSLRIQLNCLLCAMYSGVLLILFAQYQWEKMKNYPLEFLSSFSPITDKPTGWVFAGLFSIPGIDCIFGLISLSFIVLGIHLIHKLMPQFGKTVAEIGGATYFLFVCSAWMGTDAFSKQVQVYLFSFPAMTAVGFGSTLLYLHLGLVKSETSADVKAARLLFENHSNHLLGMQILLVLGSIGVLLFSQKQSTKLSSTELSLAQEPSFELSCEQEPIFEIEPPKASWWWFN